MIRPDYYNNGIEVIDFIHAYDLGFDLGNAVKYIARAGKKSEQGMSQIQKEIQDLEKADTYIQMRIKYLKENDTTSLPF